MSTTETITEMPTMCSTQDITSLIGSKRKRKSHIDCTQTTSLKPVLRGSFRQHQSKVSWSGCWGLTKDSFSKEFSDAVVKAPFYFERKSLVSENSVDNGILAQDGYFNGYFCMQDLSRPTLNCSYKKFYEKEVLLRFVKSSSAHEYDVVGSGQNKFGKYLIEGKFYPESNEIYCARNYLPNPKKTPSPTKRRARNLPNPNFKRSSRIRTPSAKYMEAFGLDEPKPQMKPPTFEFEGKDLIVKLLAQFSEKNESSQATKLLDDLSKRKIRSLKTAFRQLYEISLVVKDASGLSDLKDGLKALQVKYGLKVSKKRPLSGKDEETPSGTSEGYISLFENVNSIQEIDPLGFNLTCRLPEKLKAARLSGMVDLSKTFDCNSSKDKLPAEQEEKLSFTSEIEEMYPIHIENVDFSDLSTLDAETIKELNAFVEFSCPSKGS